METKKEKKNIGLIILVVILLVTCIGMGTFIFINRDKLTTKENTTIEEKNTDKTSNEVTNEEKAILERFIKAASIDDDIVSEIVTAKYFNKGTTEITKEIKLKMAYNDIVNSDKKEEYVLTDEDITQMTTTIPKEQLGGNGVSYENVTVIKTSDFEQAYKDFFNEDAIYSLDDIKDLGCPAPWGINKGLGNIYLFHRCGGVSLETYITEIVSYEKDRDYYLVHQKGGWSTEDKTEKTTKILWKFNKDLNFVSTEIE